MRTTRILVTLFTGVLAVLVTGCSQAAPSFSAPTGPAPLPRHGTVAELADAMVAGIRKAETATFTMVGGADGMATPLLNARGSMRYGESGLSMRLTQEVATPGGPGATAGPKQVGMVLLPDTAYIKLPPEAGLPPERPWVAVQPGGTDALSQRLGPLVEQVRQSADPSTSIARFADVATISEAVEEPLDGVPAMRYTLSIDVAKAAAASNEPGLRQALAAGITSIEAQMWLDAADRVQRLLIEQPLPNGSTFSIDLRYADWGQPVDITAPPADQVTQR